MKLISAASLALLMPMAAQAASYTYEMTVLQGASAGDITAAWDINEHGVIAGSTREVGGASRAVTWDADLTMTRLADPVATYDNSYAYGINDLGQVIGEYRVNSEVHGVIWETDGSVTLLDDLPEGAEAGYGKDINNHGQAVGTGTGTHYRRPVYWDGTTAVDYFPYGGEGWSAGVNDAGVIAGSRGSLGFVYDIAADSFSYLLNSTGGISMSGVQGINELGQVVGWSRESGDAIAALWDSDLSMTVLEDLAGGSNASLAYALNDLGQVVGTGYDADGLTAVLWDGDGPLALKTLFDNSDGWRVNYAYNINNSGVILAQGYNPDGMRNRALLLTPVAAVPVPAGILFLASAVMGLGALRRRG